MPPLTHASPPYGYFLTDDHDKLTNRFQFVLETLAMLGQDPTHMIDCSEVIPVPAPLRTKPHFPAGKTIRDVERAVRYPLPPHLALLVLTLSSSVRRDSVPNPPD